jgi:hypothetical protein
MLLSGNGLVGTMLVKVAVGKRRPVARPARRSGSPSRKRSNRIQYHSYKTPGMDVLDARRACLSHQSLAAPMALSSTGCDCMIVAGGGGVKQRLAVRNRRFRTPDKSGRPDCRLSGADPVGGTALESCGPYCDRCPTQLPRNRIITASPHLDHGRCRPLPFGFV